MKIQEQIGHHGEFYQLDFEMSFATQEDVFKVLETVISHTFKKHTNCEISSVPFRRISYKEAMEKYGTDKPDLRNPLIIKDVTDCFKNTEFNGFKNKTIQAIVAPKCNEKSRKFFDELTKYVTDEIGGKGLAYVKVEENNTLTAGISKFIQNSEELIKTTGANIGDTIFFIADEKEESQKIAGALRIELGRKMDLIKKDCFEFCFIVDFPMYELTDDGKIDFNHNPFSMPQGGMDSLINKNPLEILAYQYDLVCNGYEISSGAVRNHDPELMVKAFEIAGYTEETVKNKFGGLYNAFQYGTPPHAGAAPGLDRIVMLIAGEENIREVIAFPKNKKARDLLMRAPGKVSDEQLKEVHIKLDLDEEK